MQSHPVLPLSLGILSALSFSVVCAQTDSPAKQKPDSGAAARSGSKGAKPIADTGRKTRTVRVEMAEGLRFEPPRFEAKPGEILSLELTNADSSHLPHNFLVVKPGQVQEVVKLAMEQGEDAAAGGYIPKHPAVLASSGRVLDPEAKGKLEFTVPEEPGVYGYVCTVPGHGLLMYGAMYVGVPMPPLAKDPNVPQMTVGKGLVGGGRRPFVQRIFMPGSGPAAVAVALPGGMNFCFDAGACRVRYVWSGPFLDAARQWRGNGKDPVELGDKPWWTSEAFPLALEGAVSGDEAPKFLGYTLLEGVPEFHFRLGAQDVFQSVSSVEGGVEFRFRLPGRSAKVVFRTDAGAEWGCAQGRKAGEGFEIEGAGAGAFAVSLRSRTPLAPFVEMPVGAAPAVGTAGHAVGTHKVEKGAKPEEKPSARVTEVRKFFKITPVKAPQGVDPQVGGLAALADGRIVAAFHRGEVAVYDPAGAAWSVIAEGLHEPLGILPEADGSFLVMQRPELTRLRASKSGGKADRYETVWDGFGMTGNYHEFAFGPVRNAAGKVFVSLNLASSGDTVFKEVRGEWLPVGLERSEFYTDWKKNAAKAGRMYSRVPWRGWVMEVDPATGTAVPYACGFRSPDGLGLDAAGNLLVSDNQGDWRGTSEVHVVKKDGFYGHPASLPWRANWGTQPPLEVPLETLEQLRTPAAIWFPQGSYANSPTQMVRIPDSKKWGPYAGQLLIGEMNVPKLLRMTLEEVGGKWQGACYPFVETPEMERGAHRFAFSGDALWVGRTHLSWAGGEQLAFVEPTGVCPFDPLEIKVTRSGFSVRFTAALGAEALKPEVWNVRRYAFSYHSAYGSKELNEEWMSPESVTLSSDGLTADLHFAQMPENFVYDFYLERLRSATGEAPLNVRAAYTLRAKP